MMFAFALLAAAASKPPAAASPAQIAVPAMPASAVPPLDPAVTPYHAEGYGPGWTLEVRGGRLDFRANRVKQAIFHVHGLSHVHELDVPVGNPRITFDGFHWSADGQFGGIRVDVRHGFCRGIRRRPFEDVVEVTLNKTRFEGCGSFAAPVAQADGLEGTRWRLQWLERQEIGKEADVTLDFSRGRVIGRTGCNAFGAAYTLAGDRLHFDHAISTEVACRPGDHQLERAVFSLLGQQMAIRFRHGELWVRSADGHSARFVRQLPTMFERTRRWRARPEPAPDASWGTSAQVPR